VFIDETWTATTMARSHGRSLKGERLRMGVPHGHHRTTTLIAGRRTSEMVAPMVLDGPINGDWFEAYVAHVLMPELRRGAIVIMDNLSSHTRASVRESVEAAGATLLFLLPIALTSIPSKRPSLVSKPCFAKPPSEPSPHFGTSSASSSTSSSQPNTPTTSARGAMTQTDQNLL
jgi:hypothetical protein